MGRWRLAVVGLSLAWFAGVCEARMVGEPMPLGLVGFSLEMERNPEIRAYVERRGYPDWAELVEVDDGPPLAPHEVHLYYFRLDREIAFTEAYLLGSPDIGLRRYERPLAPAKRAWIERAYLRHDPASRAEFAAERAAIAATRAERAAATVVAAAERSERIADKAARAFEARLRK
jgi:hypothetical protein